MTQPQQQQADFASTLSATSLAVTPRYGRKVECVPCHQESGPFPLVVKYQRGIAVVLCGVDNSTDRQVFLTQESDVYQYSDDPNGVFSLIDDLYCLTTTISFWKNSQILKILFPWQAHTIVKKAESCRPDSRTVYVFSEDRSSITDIRWQGSGNS